MADTDTDEITVDVTVASQTRIDVNPKSITWGATEPGTTNDTHFSLEMENIGTRNISTVYVDASNAASDPFSTADPANYNATEYVLLNNTETATFYYADSLSWNESKPGYIIPPSGWTEGDSTGYFGKFRTVSLSSGTADVGQQYYWFTAQDADAGNCSNGTVYIATSPKTDSASGQTDFSSHTGDALTEDANQDWGYTDISNGGDAAMQDYAVGVSADCSQVIIFRYNYNLCSSCSNVDYLYDDTLTPGNKTFYWVALKVPQGVPDGNMDTGIFTFTAEGN
ncbi:MAG: hypothetical protein JW754_01370 [Candidatus Aenigmarchaeota archaeon]|nr:hypothetical protein [Candidatus Aenigmarchaeota archaeon]